MKKIFLISLLFLFYTNLFSQNDKLPSVTIMSLDGRNINTESLLKEGKPIFIDFWATWCKPCIIELNTLSDLYDDWQEKTGIIIYAISIDDPKTSNRVAPFVSSRDWEFNVLLDPNSDFKRAMNVVNVPQSFLISADGKIVWRHIGFAPGDEDEIYSKIINLVNSSKKENNEK